MTAALSDQAARGGYHGSTNLFSHAAPNPVPPPRVRHLSVISPCSRLSATYSNPKEDTTSKDANPKEDATSKDANPKGVGAQPCCVALAREVYATVRLRGRDYGVDSLCVSLADAFFREGSDGMTKHLHSTCLTRPNLGHPTARDR